MSAKHYFKKIVHVKHTLLHNPSIPIHVLGSLEEAIRVPVPHVYASEASAYTTVPGLEAHALASCALSWQKPREVGAAPCVLGAYATQRPKKASEP